MRTKFTIALMLLCSIYWSGQAQCTGADFQEVGGIAVLEMESATSRPSGWNVETSRPGFTGSSFLAWRGANFFNSPGNAVINYRVRINTPGVYRFQWHNRVGIGSNGTEHNDSWLRIPDAYDFFAERNGVVKYPQGGKFRRSNNVVRGSSGGGWMKIYNAGGASSFNWSTLSSDFDLFNVFAEFRAAGVYTIQVSARSNGHFIDRMVLYRSNISESSATSLSRSVTPCSGGGGGGGGTNNAPTVSITGPSNGQNFAVGSTVTVSLNANDSDGSITRHRIFLNNTLVDSDGSTYSPYRISNISAGSYTVRAEVTDNSGATDESSVSFTVGEGGGGGGGSDDAPTVSITSPSNGQNFSAGSAVTVNLSANDSDGNVVRHQVFVNGALVDTDGSNFTPYTANNLNAGNHTVRAVVTDNDGNTSEDSVSFTVGGGSGGGNNAPTVSITSPNNGQNFAAGSTVMVNLSANDSDGSVMQHQIFVNGNLVDTDGSSFTPHAIRNAAAGTYVVRAVVTDNDGATAENTVSFTVGNGGGGNNSTVTFSLINAGNNSVISTLANGSTVSTGQNVSIRANTSNSSVRSVRLTLGGTQSSSRIENVAPYALFGDTSGNYNGSNLVNGNYTISATLYSGAGGSGSDLGTTSISFTVGSSNSREVAVEEPVIYPNPVLGDSFNVSIPNKQNGSIEYYILTVAGSVVGQGSGEIYDGILSVSTTDLNEGGIYILVYHNGMDEEAVRFVKN